MDHINVMLVGLVAAALMPIMIGMTTLLLSTVKEMTDDKKKWERNRAEIEKYI